MPIPNEPPEPTHYRVLLTDPDGYDSGDVQRLLEDCGLTVVRIEEISASEMDAESRKPNDAVRFVPRADRKVG